MINGGRFVQSTLTRQILTRMMAALSLTLVVMGVGVFLVYHAIDDARVKSGVENTQAFYKERIAKIDEDWKGHARYVGVSIGFYRLLDDENIDEHRITSFLTAANVLDEFSSFGIVDAHNNVIYSLGLPLNKLPDVTKSTTGSWREHIIWHYERGVLYRVYDQRLVTASGPVHLLFFRVMDNATLYDNAIPHSDLFLVWQGAVVASSIGSLDSVAEQAILDSLGKADGGQQAVAMSWGQADEKTPTLVARLNVSPLVSFERVTLAGAFFLLTFSFLAWLILGRELTRVARNISLLSVVARNFSSARALDEAKLAALMTGRGSSEVTSLAASLNDLMGTVLRQEAEGAAHEDELRRRNDEISLLLDSAGEGFYGIDTEGLCTFINRACLNMFGYDSADEVLGRNLHELTHHTLPDGTPYPGEVCRIRDARKTGVGVWVADEVFWRKDGSSFPAEYSAFPIQIGDRYVGTVVGIMDITLRNEALESLRRQAIDHEIIAKIMALSLAPIPLKEMLEQTLKLVLTSHDLGLQSCGSIFLSQGNELQMIAQQGLHPHLLTACDKVPFGHCLCGRAAATGAVVYAQSVDDRHDIHFPEMTPHGHYCMPIQGGGEVLGVINLYVAAGHGGSEHELRFVSVVADTLAGVIRHHRVEDELHRGEERLRSLVENASDCIIVHNFDGRIISANRRACLDLGYTSEELAQVPLPDIDVGFNAAKYNDLWLSMTPGVPVVLTTRYRHKDGSLLPVEVHLGYYETGTQPLVVLLAHNITDRLLAEERIKHIASHDTLTELPNRSLFLDRLTRALIAARRSTHGVAVLFIDLDGFKAVNDTMGHAAGDSLLRQVSTRLSACVREMDTVARLGGDEFTILMIDVIDHQAAIRVAELILKVVSAPFPIEGLKDAHIGASIGIAQSPDDGESTEELLAAADRAMYAVKKGGKNHYLLASSLGV